MISCPDPRGRSGFVTLVLALLFAACPACAPEAPGDELVFRVDNALLGSPFLDESGGVTVRPPAGWEPLPSAEIEGALSEVAAGLPADASRRPRVLAAYHDSRSGSFFAVSRYEDPSASGDLQPIVQAQESRMRQAESAPEVSSAVFSHHGFRMTQLMAVTTPLIILKLFAERPGLDAYQLDYVVPSSSYHDLARTLESSIGSLGVTPARRST